MRRLQLFALLALVSCAAARAEKIEIEFLGPRLNLSLLPLPVPVPTGADFGFSLGLADAPMGPTALFLRLGAGYEDEIFLRDAVSGDPISVEEAKSSPMGGQRYQSPNAQWDFGIVQGLAESEGENLVEAFLLYRGRFDIHDTSLPDGRFADMRGLFSTSVIAGAAYEGLERDSRRVVSGAAAEASAEWSPSFANAGTGPTDFYRLNLQAEGYLPLATYGLPSDPSLNLFSLYLAGFASLDYAEGRAIPIYVLQGFGGRKLHKSLGSSVRGYPSRGFDSGRKAVASAELRALGPALLGKPWFMPLLLAFCDVGYYSGLPGAASAAYANSRGAVYSAGLGFQADVVDFAYLGCYAGWKFPGDDLVYERYGETDPFFLSFTYRLHF